MDTRKIIELEKRFVMQTYSRPGIVIDHGKGCYVFDKNGKKYIDLVGGLATCTLGHGNKEFADDVKEQLKKITNPTNLYYTEEQVLLAEKLAKLSGLDKSFFSNSGTESVEAAIKLARKHTKKTWIISTKNSFHGRTFGSLAATGKEKIKTPFKPLLSSFKHVEYGNADAVEKAINKKTAAVIVEPIQGEAGIIVPPQDYLKKLRNICNKHNILMIVDEVQTGYGRTGKFFAFQHSKVKPDIVTLAKGLANGIPIGVTISKENIAKSFAKNDHGSTFGGNPVACKAANFTVDYIIKNKLVDNAAVQGKYLMQKLNTIKSKSIKEIRGKGLMLGMEMKKNASKIQKNCLDKGLLVNLTAEKVLRFLPPLTINRKIIDAAVEILMEVTKNED
ncbi:MAG: acetylornithine transaminase [Nanoarchaeota archaeon]|nr:acetylornithine transaminase [Nanoarchaeota archaeon]